MINMTTWQDYASSSGAAVTRWNYNGQRGWLDNKRYADNQGPSYTYTAAGRLQTRSWARGVSTTYGYNNAGALSTVDYSDSTPDVSYTFDRRGRQSTIVQGGTTTTLAHNLAGEMLCETNNGGTLNGLSVTNGYDSLMRRTTVTALSGPSTVLATAGYGYDGASRLNLVTSGTAAVGYSYLANSPLLSQISFTNGGTQRMVTTKQHDFLNRLMSISSAPSASSVVSFSYAYNSANQRTLRREADGSYWRYEFDPLGQVKSGKKYWSDGTPVAGQQFEYGFDDIGNRKQTKVGGDENGLNLRTNTYGANLLNQYTNRSVQGAVDVMGVALATNSVTVNTAAAYRKGEYFRKELTVNNGSAPVWQQVDVAAPNETSVTRHEFVPKTPEAFAYDADGNLTSDGRWTNTWDAENRLVKVESLNSAPAGSKRKVTWEFDGKGRRIRQTTYDGSSGSYVVTEDLKFLSDGWRHIAELNATNNAVIRSYVWGLDLTGTLDGAGGVGGLLMMSSAANGTHFYAFDGNGNVAVLVKASDGTSSGSYKYGPFGESLRVTGAAGSENSFRFSTKRTSDTLSLVLYEFRPYSPGMGLLMSQEPAREAASPNPRAFVCNFPIQAIDSDGRGSFSTSLATLGGNDLFEFESDFSIVKSGNQLAEYTRELAASKIRFENALISLCPNCEDAVFQSRKGRTQKCSLHNCIRQAEKLASALAKNYAVVFTTQYRKFGDILTGKAGNERADKAPEHGMNASDYDKGFGLKCAGWMDLTADKFYDAISPYYAEGSQCFRAARVGRPKNRDSWFNHSWVVIYGPRRGKLESWMFRRGDYDAVVDPWPTQGKFITPPSSYDAKRMDQELLW